MAPTLNSKRASLVLSKIDEILAWEKSSDRDRDTQFVELGRYLCEVRAGQYWRLDNLRSFDEYLERKFPESRRQAYYLMAIHEHLPKIPKQYRRKSSEREFGHVRRPKSALIKLSHPVNRLPRLHHSKCCALH